MSYIAVGAGTVGEHHRVMAKGWPALSSSWGVALSKALPSDLKISKQLRESGC